MGHGIEMNLKETGFQGVWNGLIGPTQRQVSGLSMPGAPQVREFFVTS